MSAVRFSDEKLQEFYQEFLKHVEEFHKHISSETDEHRQQQELYDAIFRQEDIPKNVSAGLLQLTMRIDAQLKELKAMQEKRRTFLGGVVFTVSTLWFFVTDTGAKLQAIWHKLF